MSESIGAALRTAREQRRLTLAQVSEATRIRGHYLQALENDDLSAIPSAAQARGFLRLYSQFLSLDLEALIPPAAAATAPTVPAASAPESAAQPAAPTTEAGRPGTVGGLLLSLRERLLRRKTAEPTAEAAEPEPGSESKKKTPGVEATEPPVHLPAAEEPPATSVVEPGEPSEPLATPAGSDAGSDNEAPPISDVEAGQRPRISAVDAMSARLTALFAGVRHSAPPPEAEPDEIPADEPGETGQLSNSRDFNPLPAEEPAELPSSEEIFAEIGRQLRARREMLSLTHEEIERHTHVRASFLKALESGALEGLPSPVQARGILANYAAFIDLNPDTILLRFADGIQARHREQRPGWPQRTRSPMTVHSDLPPLRAFIASDLLFGGGAAIMLILFAVWGINRVVSLRADRPLQGGSPSIPEVLAQAEVPTVPSEITLIPAVDTAVVPTLEVALAEAPTPVDPSITVQVKLTSTERTYLRVLVDDKPAFEGRTEPGKDYYYQAARQIEVLAGNAAALRVLHNGTDRGTLGGYGQVVDQLYTARGVFTPTPTTPPTATASATPTSTLRATPTLATFTPTARIGE